MRELLLLVFLLLFSAHGWSQVDMTKSDDLKFKQITMSLPALPDSLVQSPSQSIMVNNDLTAPMVEYNTTIFCKFEHKLMMSTKLPLKMRLGDVNYVDRLEGKRD